MSERIDGDLTGTATPPRPAPTLRAHQGRADGPLRISDSRAGLRAGGAVDLNSHRDWERVLRRAVDQGADVHLDLADLGFIDSRGVTALVDASNRLPLGRRIVVHRAPSCMRRIMEVLWPDGVRAVDITGDLR